MRKLPDSVYSDRITHHVKNGAHPFPRMAPPSTRHSIDAVHDDLLSCAQAADALPGKVAASSVWRWCTRGSHGIYLEHVRLGRRLWTTKAALAEFARATASAALNKLVERRDVTKFIAPVRPATRRRSIEAAERELAADGIGN